MFCFRTNSQESSLQASGPLISTNQCRQPQLENQRDTSASCWHESTPGQETGMKQNFKKMGMKRRLAIGVIRALSATPLMAKTVNVAQALDVEVDESVTGEYHFAHGFGLLYGAMPVTRSLGVLEKMYPNATFTWRTVQNTSEQRDAMMANRLDFGSCSAGPFLQGWDKGVGWVWLQTTSGFDAYLMVQPDGPDNITEFI